MRWYEVGLCPGFFIDNFFFVYHSIKLTGLIWCVWGCCWCQTRQISWCKLGLPVVRFWERFRQRMLLPLPQLQLETHSHKQTGINTLNLLHSHPPLYCWYTWPKMSSCVLYSSQPYMWVKESSTGEMCTRLWHQACKIKTSRFSQLRWHKGKRLTTTCNMF